MGVCQVDECGKPVSKPGHALCLDHWKAERAGNLARCTACGRYRPAGVMCPQCGPTSAADAVDDDDAPVGTLSSTKIGRHFGLSNVRVNLILAELGWVERYGAGWAPTDRGNALGANVKAGKKAPYVVWPEPILTNAALLASIAEQIGHPPKSATPATGAPRKPKSDDFRTKFDAKFLASDGHWVRSRAELLIDNWLYMQGLVHAYERRLPIEEDCYCDFYLPAAGAAGGKGVYIEYWGRESDPKYRERQAVKRAIYTKHELRLIELGDAEIERMDDVLPRALLRLGVQSA